MTPPNRPQSPLNTAEYFGRLAATYGGGEYYRRRREASLIEIRRHLKSPARVLDLGCGNGTYLAEFRETVKPLLLAGADLSLSMLREARRRGATILTACDAAALPFRSGTWDAIFCSHVLQFVKDLARCFGEIDRCLTAGGTLVIAGGDLGTRERLRTMIDDPRWSRFREELPRPRDVGWRRNLAEYQRAAEGAGFDVEPRQTGFTVTWPDLAEFYRIRWLPLVESPTRAALNDLLDQVAAGGEHEEIRLSESLLFCRKRGSAA
jgi:SAM-dependent methyltransferase